MPACPVSDIAFPEYPDITWYKCAESACLTKEDLTEWLIWRDSVIRWYKDIRQLCGETND